MTDDQKLAVEFGMKLRNVHSIPPPDNHGAKAMADELLPWLKAKLLEARLDELIEIPIYPKGCHTPEDATKYVLRRIDSVEKEIATFKRMK